MKCDIVSGATTAGQRQALVPIMRLVSSSGLALHSTYSVVPQGRDATGYSTMYIARYCSTGMTCDQGGRVELKRRRHKGRGTEETAAEMGFRFSRAIDLFRIIIEYYSRIVLRSTQYWKTHHPRGFSLCIQCCSMPGALHLQTRSLAQSVCAATRVHSNTNKYLPKVVSPLT